ncbi:MAG: hypothetical protein ACRDNF_24455 [Streptosporangiaceae bacterium]
MDDVAREFPGWQPYRAASGLYFARPPGGDHVVGEDPLDLRDQIRGWLGRHEGQGPSGAEQASGQPTPSGSGTHG